MVKARKAQEPFVGFMDCFCEEKFGTAQFDALSGSNCICNVRGTPQVFRVRKANLEITGKFAVV